MDFCTRCLESKYAEALGYRTPIERAQNLIDALYIWLFCGLMAFGGGMLLLLGWQDGIEVSLSGALMFAVATVVLWKTTRSFLAKQ